ncbi:SDR family NAD(P)-dependent oxidoreductase [Sinanaerobacter chloroacetimidivorans]|uniref:SDR family oxidoreductase n=1 Tax=Sinanaerobacter chloroacetimidivorans TaxID=2818044 RepID=A0A8J7W2Q5_9FIRM|nr:SDR family NAD(P)-dependent oxidoreductase [Sinanaerobacter chloroacetimidivorans]MBR0599789.1 SDR family oxidoreductase [Sinanaerobacter chloroacetimidivorans]
MSKFEGKIAIVTGGSSGIGAATALALAKDGADVVVHYNGGKERAEKIAQEIQAMGRKAIALKANLRSKVEIFQLVEDTIAEFGKIDILVNSAGRFDHYTNYETITPEIWDEVIETDITGTFFFCKYASDYMIKSRKGVIVTVASAAGVISNGGGPAYTTSKWATIGMMKNLTAFPGCHGIRANTICPGLVATPMVSDLLDSDDFMSKINGTPAGRVGTPEDMAKLICFLASDDAEYIHGDAILIDGGLVANGGL